jgi:hypothetical protein
MKRIVSVTLCALILFGTLWLLGATSNPANTLKSRIKATVTVDKQYTASAWKKFDSCAVVCTDTCVVMYVLSGVAQIRPGDQLFLGMSTDSAIAGGASKPTKPTLDTARVLHYPIVKGDASIRTMEKIPFFYRMIDSSTVAQGASKTDTVFVYGACNQSGQTITLEDVMLTVQFFRKSY